MEVNIHHTTINTDNVFHVRILTTTNDKLTQLREQLSQKKLQLVIKRVFDVCVASLLIILFFPAMLIIYLLIKFTSRGSAIFSNERIGLNGLHFRCYKFRSMIQNPTPHHDDHKRALQHQHVGILHKRKNDARITFVGRILRKSSLDELPQLFNVLRGDMSIVGPRPLVPFMLKPFPEFTRLRCLVKPGITGLWQVRDREHNTSAEFMMPHDLEYIETYSLNADIKILLKTPTVVISAKGAY